MLRIATLTISSLLVLGLLGCDSSPPPAKQASKQAPAKAADVPPAVTPPATPAEPTPPPEPTTTVAPDPAVDAPTDTAEPEPEAEPEAEPEPAPEPAPSGGWQAPAGADIRSDAVIPPGTPAEHAAAFKRLPQAKTDGPPVGGIGPNGIHFDSMVVGRGWEKSRCVEPSTRFSAGTDDRVNICLRVVHPAGVAEELTVEWSKVGSNTARRSTVTVKDMHAYLTRSYLPIKTGYEGQWNAKIKTADGTVLGEASFTIE